MVNDVSFLPKGSFDCHGSAPRSSCSPSLRFYEWKKNVTKTPYFIYQTDPLLNEKHYPDINVEQVRQKLDEAHPGKLPLLAMAGLFEVNRFCEVGRDLECIGAVHLDGTCVSPRPILCIHVRSARSTPVQRWPIYTFECR